jgi:hypothetical protein
MRRLLILSDIFSVRLIKGYVEPFTFSVKQVSHPQSLIQTFQETNKRIIFFDEEYTNVLLKYI